MLELKLRGYIRQSYGGGEALTQIVDAQQFFYFGRYYQHIQGAS